MQLTPNGLHQHLVDSRRETMKCNKVKEMNCIEYKIQ